MKRSLKVFFHDQRSISNKVFKLCLSVTVCEPYSMKRFRTFRERTVEQYVLDLQNVLKRKFQANKLSQHLQVKYTRSKPDQKGLTLSSSQPVTVNFFVINKYFQRFTKGSKLKLRMLKNVSCKKKVKALGAQYFNNGSERTNEYEFLLD